MQACDFCGYDGNGDAISFHRFTLEEENRRRWTVNMRRDAEWTPSESASLCSAHFTPDCFESGSAHLHPNAIPTIFDFTQCMIRFFIYTSVISLKQNLNTENIPQDQGEHKSTDSSCCGCYKRLQATEKVYQLKLAAAQLQIKEYKKNLAEESRKTAKWQKRAIVLQSAIRAMKQRGIIPTTRKTSTPKKY
ncbi:THAP domain-containing protein 2 [Triplophysa rosa]|uniref:THAP domain-containing protein 2 n=1 Tax=Triplophysa rosa TaxID=992332 RepID=UPI0025461B3E|nr:THAP domain-containing protein 2 [Triplophysa rosa]